MNIRLNDAACVLFGGGDPGECFHQSKGFDFYWPAATSRAIPAGGMLSDQGCGLVPSKLARRISLCASR